MYKYFILVFLAGAINLANGQAKLWTKVTESDINLRSTDQRPIVPTKYLTFRLDNNVLDLQVNQAPQEFSAESLNENTTMDLPMPNGQMETFVIWDSPVMEKELADKYPSIKSYKGYQKNNRSVVTRFTKGPNGFHAAIKTEEGMVYIDPFSTAEHDHYITYFTADDPSSMLPDGMKCGVEDTGDLENHHDLHTDKGSRTPGGLMEFRKYKLALACTGDWGVVRGTVENALADMVAFVDKANIVFETEVALRLVLIANNDKLIYLDPNQQPYTSTDMGLVILGQNTAILNGRVGSSSYQVGHVFSKCYDVGGVAGGNICTSAKGAGVTCYNSNSLNYGTVLVFNHEVGHQMTASHTFNHCPGQEGQLASGTAFEPGSGSTIMAYPGACGSSNLGVSREAYYHGGTLEQILSYTNTDSSDGYICAEKVDIDNHYPEITLPYYNGFYIPKSTPFYLKGQAIDQDGDPMTFVWEDIDNYSAPLGNPLANSPLFKSLKSTSNTARYFPNISSLLNGNFTDNTELLPTYGRSLSFRFTVRDNNPLGNAVSWQDIKFNVAADAGPFKITYPLLDYKFKIGDKVEVTWDVANTNKAPVNCDYVDIYVSINRSLDFESNDMILVASKVPNDGSQSIIIPNRISKKVRFVIKANDNIFLTTSLFDSYIDGPTAPSFFMDVANSYQESCLPANVSYDISTLGLAGLMDSIHFDVVSGLPQNGKAKFSQDAIAPGGTTTLHLDLSEVDGSQEYVVIVRSFVPGIDTIEREVRLKTTGKDIDFVNNLLPLNGSSGVGPTQKYFWRAKPDATSYKLEVASSPSFSSESIVFSTVRVDTFFLSNTFLDKAKVYYWRVRSENNCRPGQWSQTFAFITEALNCTLVSSGELSKIIPQSKTSTLEAALFIPTVGEISDINVSHIKGEHQWVGDLVVTLISPKGTSCLLWSKKCSSSQGFSVGVDDQSNDYFQCPVNTGKIYRPQSPLSIFNGESMQGDWILKIEDQVLGNGGKLINFDIEICSNFALSPPKLVKNIALQIHPKDIKVINNELLLTEDLDNGPQELTYSMVKLPTKGILTLDGVPMVEGSTFHQDDIDKLRIKYTHTASDQDLDGFDFVVQDGKGGWVEITRFDIDVNTIYPSKTTDIQSKNVLVFPNPADQTLNIQLLSDGMKLSNVGLWDMTGRKITDIEMAETLTSISIGHLASGVYALRFQDQDGHEWTKKVVKR